ncbi:hypothetical protein BN948_02034 [Hydrogenophaga intermedia]|uniref:DUF1854 domain-containing protein n=2 Tax=Comamonadaceae TaxID=80864 RepID=A0A1L1PCC1_HYDIT|nr:hypothetical protein BN948_02034 [Hydrogenophaga intermedia]
MDTGTQPMTTPDWTLRRDPQGPLQLTTADGQLHTDVLPVRAFPLAEPGEGLSLVGSDGHELLWIDHLSTLDAATRALIEEELAPREFMPRIERILSVSSYATPSTWTVATARGPAQLVLKAEDDIRRLEGGRLLIQDGHGVLFEVADRFALDRVSKRILNRFL